MKKIIVFLVFTFFSMGVYSNESILENSIVIQDYVRGSFQSLKDQHVEKPFIISFWSIDCTYCFEEMKMFSVLKEKHPDLDVVLVSTDVNIDHETVYKVLDETGFMPNEAWVFADDFSQRLYAEADHDWRGELPKTIFFNSKHESQSVVGEVKSELVEKWLQYLKGEN